MFCLLADAEILLSEVREAEKAVNASKKAADSAEKSSMEAKKIGEEAAQNITTLIKVRKNWTFVCAFFKQFTSKNKYWTV